MSAGIGCITVLGLILAAAGVLLMWSDRHDFPWCWHDDPYRFRRFQHRS